MGVTPEPLNAGVARGHVEEATDGAENDGAQPPWIRDLFTGRRRVTTLTPTERGHGPIIVLVMARVRQNGESSLLNSVISNQ